MFFTYLLFSISVKWCKRPAEHFFSKKKKTRIKREKKKSSPSRSDYLLQLNLCMTPKQTTRCLATLYSYTQNRTLTHTRAPREKSNETNHIEKKWEKNTHLFSTLRQAQQFNRHIQALVLTLICCYEWTGVFDCLRVAEFFLNSHACCLFACWLAHWQYKLYDTNMYTNTHRTIKTKTLWMRYKMYLNLRNGAVKRTPNPLTQPHQRSARWD